MAKFYARDFLSVCNYSSYYDYEKEYISIWGEKWEKELNNEYKHKKL